MKRLILLLPIILLCGCEKTATVKPVEVFPFTANFSISEFELYGTVFMEDENSLKAEINDSEEIYTVSIDDANMTVECNGKQYIVNAEYYTSSPLYKIKNILTDLNGKDAVNSEYISNNEDIKYTVKLNGNKPEIIYTDEYNIEF